jgi:multimeric flavodoxin WrbA
MEVIAFNGSPRKKWNTATLLEKALEGAASQGAETKLVHLYDLDSYRRIRKQEYFNKITRLRAVG